MEATRACDVRDQLLHNLRQRRIPGLDGLRGFAALSVVGFHDYVLANHDGSGRIYPGRISVQVFFVISGLLITWRLLQEEQRDGRVNRATFYWRRAFRLFPALFALLIWQCVTHLPQASPEALAASAFYVANYYGIFHGSLEGLGQTWSLAVEEHFYLIWPQVFVFARSRRSLLRGCLIFAGLQIAWRMAAGFHGHYVYAELATETASCAALIGCALALMLWHYPQRLPRFLLHPALTPVSLAVIVGLTQLPRDEQLFWGVALAIPFAVVLVLQAITYKWQLLENPIARFLGRISYGIYVWGMAAIAIIEKVGHDRLHLAVFAVAIALATASYFLIEQPIQSFGRKWLAGIGRESSTAPAY